ncbi:solute carrier family 35 member F1-like isoform X2 [Oscarella lobularis]|uniref:solute carrier family 35 member F1-like isoform X2 n=1 Tax=Oscarella lobularis TaxID=121494 RepID=UPI003314241A
MDIVNAERRLIDEDENKSNGRCDLHCDRASCKVRTDWRRVLKVLALGQFLSLLIMTIGTTSQSLQRLDFYAPTTQSFFVYLLVALVFGSSLAYRHDDDSESTKRDGIVHVLRKRGIVYFFVAIVDVEANYLVIKSYHFTSLTSVQLIDGLAVVSVVVLSLIFLGVRYRILHYAGVILGMLGTVSLILADVHKNKSNSQELNAALGDGLAASGAIMYGISNVAQEYLVKKHGEMEFRAMIGIFGAFVSGTQACILERDSLLFIDWARDAAKIGGFLFGFTASGFLFYVCTPILMRMSSALLFVLSLLTADLFSIIIGIFVFDFKFSAIYFLSVGLIVAGLIVYSWKDPPVSKGKKKAEQEESEKLKN